MIYIDTGALPTKHDAIAAGDDVIIDGGHIKEAQRSHGGAGGHPNDDDKGTDDGEAETDDDKNDQVPGDPAGGPHSPRGPRGCC